MTEITYNNFVRELIKNVPELQEIFISHMKDHEILLPHVFLEDVFRYLEKMTLKRLPEWAFKLINFLENAIISSDVKVQELICFSFLDNLAYYLIKNNKKREIIRSSLKPNLMKELQSVENWKPSSQNYVKKPKGKSK